MIWKVWETLYQTTLEEGMATHSNVLAWRIPMDRGAWWAIVRGITKSLTQLSNKQQYVAEIPKCTISDFSTLT